MTSKAFAKINLFLDVIGKRDDGYHNIRSVMHTVSLCDELDIKVSPSDITNIKFSTNVKALNGCDNLAYRAIELYLSKSGIKASVKAKLIKNIPEGSGLGGGSSDAAAALRLLNSELSYFSEREMLGLAAELGSDVPFLYVGGTAYCEGRGENVNPIGCSRKFDFVITIGDERISTPLAYKDLDIAFSNFDGSVSTDDFEKLPKLALTENVNSQNVPVYNIFEKVIAPDFGNVFSLKERLMKMGAQYTLMSGSGPAVFGIFDDAETAKKAEIELKNEGILAFYAHSI